MKRINLDQLIRSHSEADIAAGGIQEAMGRAADSLPLYAYYEILNKKSLGFTNWHWHEEVECLLVIQGDINFYVDEQHFIVHPGEGLIINSRQLHMSRPVTPGTGILVCFKFSPRVLQFYPGSAFDQKYVTPFLSSAVFTAHLLRPHTSWCKELMNIVQKLYILRRNHKEGYELDMMAQVFHLWSVFLKNLPRKEVKKSIVARHQAIAKGIMDYISRHYSEDFSIDDIAAATSYSSSECCRIFKSALNQTIYQYLNLYRIEKAAAALKETSEPISDIARQTGFCSTSYFIKCFKAQLKVTPLQFRKRNQALLAKSSDKAASE